MGADYASYIVVYSEFVEPFVFGIFHYKLHVWQKRRN